MFTTAGDGAGAGAGDGVGVVAGAGDGSGSAVGGASTVNELDWPLIVTV